MKNQIKYFVIGFVVILFSSPLGVFAMNFYNNLVGNLAAEYTPVLEGFLSSFRLIGILIFSIGLAEILKKK